MCSSRDIALQTERHTDMLITILCSFIRGGGKIKKNIKSKQQNVEDCRMAVMGVRGLGIKESLRTIFK